MRRRTLVVAGLATTALAMGGCTGGGEIPDGSPMVQVASPTPGTGDDVATRPAAEPPSTPAPTTATAEQTLDPASIQALIDTHYDGRNLKLGREGGSTEAYRQYFATYQGDGLTISGRINVPCGKGPFPAVILAHGYVPIDKYTNGATMLRERDHLARHGYVTLHIDYRNHAQSSHDPDLGRDLRTGYVKDAINAGLALRQLDSVDPDRIAIVGRSMGGGVVYGALVARPGLFRAGVAYSPVSSDTVDTFNRFIRRDSSRTGAVRNILDRLGTPEQEPARWATTSPRTYFDRVTDPILVHHGTADEECPIAWSEETVAALKAAGKRVVYHVYPGERHTFTSQWPLSIQRTEAFLDRHFA